ncbi:MAG: arylesterase [Pseudomonadota bacterium]
MTLLRRLPLATYVPRIGLCKVLCLWLLCAIAPVWAVAAPLKLVAIGDSLTHGFGLPPADGFVPQLEAWLRAEGREVEVVNMGVSGDTTDGGRARIDWALADGGDAVIVWLGGNDLLRGIDPARSRDNLAAMAEVVRGKGLPLLLISMEAPLNYGPEFKAAFDGMYGLVAEQADALLLEDAFDGLVGTGLMQADGIHPNKDGVAQIVDVVGPKALELLDRVAE